MDEAYDAVDEIRKVFGFEALDIHADTAQETLNVRVDGRTFRLDELGSGLAEFIILLGNVRRRNPSFVLLDEPELHLHARLQAQLLQLLASHASRGVIFASHSLGLARTMAEPVYSIVPIAVRESKVEPLNVTSSLTELLGELNYAGYEALGNRTVLLAEGPSDAAVWREWLKHHENGRSVLVMPLLGGASFINGSAETKQMLADLQGLAGQVFAIIDSERSEAAQTPERRIVQFASLCGEAGIRCLVLERRSTECYLSDAAVHEHFGNEFRAPHFFERFEDMLPHWNKRQNWLVAARMTAGEVASEVSDFLQVVARSDNS
jgi:hypothetical protein